MKLILVIGKKIQRLNQFSLIVNTGDGQCSEAIKFPEIEHGAPMHVDDVLERFKFFLKVHGARDLSHIFMITHSGDIINYVGQLIYEGALACEDVEIWLYDGDEPAGEPTQKFSYDEEGVLIDWRFGFFTPGM